MLQSIVQWNLGDAMRRHLGSYLLVVVGFTLSPLSWWNDAVVNLPLAYLFSLPFSFISESIFLPSFLIGYWFSNLLGFLMMHWGGEGLLHRKHSPINVKHGLLISLSYSMVMIILVLLGWIPPPSNFLPNKG
jgi:hypothetical protein